MSLAPEHLADLKASGLTDDTIKACQFKAVPPNKLRILRGIESAYEIPYFHVNGSLNGFSRWKLFYRPDFTGDRKQKYHQAEGSDAQFFFPPKIDWNAVTSDPTHLIVFVEGEKKAIALAQVGIAAIGVSGVWNWRQKLDNGERLVLPSLDQIVLAGRPVLLLPDSDCWRPEKLQALEGFFALGMEIRSRSASPSFVVLQEAGRKVGADDWLVASGGEWQHRWPMLERVPLDDPRLAHIARWWQGWREKDALQQSLEKASNEAMEILDLAGSFQIAFPDHQTALSFQRLSENARGVSAELTVTVGHLELLGDTDIGLKSDSSRDKLARSLSKSAVHIPWKRLLERACSEVLKRHRRGEPIVLLEPANSIHVSFVINPLVYHGHQTLIFAPGGSYKSFLMLYVALLAMGGHRQNGVAAIQTNVLYLDWELDKRTVGARLKALHAGHPELAPYRPHYRRCTQPLHLEAPYIAAEVIRLNIGLVIIDSAALACGGDLHSPESAIKLQQTLRRIGCASIVLAHVSKSTAEGQDKSAYGTVFFRELARNVWELSRPEGSDRVVLSQTGANCKNSFGRKQDPLGFEFSFEPDRVRISAFNPAEEEESGFEEKLPARQRIARLLSDEVRRNPQDIADTLHLPSSTVKSELSRGRKDGIFDRFGPHQGGKWGLKKSLQPIVAAQIDAPSLQSLQLPTRVAQHTEIAGKTVVAPIVDDRCTQSLLQQGGIYIPPTATIHDSKINSLPHSHLEEVIDL